MGKDMELVTVVVLDGEELLISICLTQHRVAHQLGSSLLHLKDPMLDLLMLASTRVIRSAMFPTQGIQYSQVCGKIIGYQVGHPQAFYEWNRNHSISINEQYVDGLSLTYGNPRRHIWTFVAEVDEGASVSNSVCPCTRTSSTVPPFIGNDYFCETGVPPGQQYSSGTFHADDPLWDGQGCGPTRVNDQLSGTSIIRTLISRER